MGQISHPPVKELVILGHFYESGCQWRVSVSPEALDAVSEAFPPRQDRHFGCFCSKVLILDFKISLPFLCTVCLSSFLPCMVKLLSHSQQLRLEAEGKHYLLAPKWIDRPPSSSLFCRFLWKTGGLSFRKSPPPLVAPFLGDKLRPGTKEEGVEQQMTERQKKRRKRAEERRILHPRLLSYSESVSELRMWPQQ